ncbi:hypothetical protein Tco_1022319 [Tanacetum coccineum]
MGLAEASMTLQEIALAIVLGAVFYPLLSVSNKKVLTYSLIVFAKLEMDLCSSFRRQPRGGAEMTQFLELQAKIENVVLSDQGDTWKWSVGSATCFSVAFVRYLIDSKTLDTAPNATRWLRNIPIKMGTIRDPIAEGTEGAQQLGPEQARVYSDLSLEEKDRFIKAVKLNRGLRDSNYDQLYAYLNQHKAHANENKMLLDRFTQHTVDPLSLMSNVSQQQYYSQSSTTLPSTHLQPHFVDTLNLT